MPAAGLAGNGALNYGEAEFQTFRSHLPGGILQGKGRKGSGTRRWGGQRNTRSSGFLPQNRHIFSQKRLQTCPGCKVLVRGLEAKGTGQFWQRPRALLPSKRVLGPTCTKALWKPGQAAASPAHFFFFFTALSEQLGHLRRQPEVPPAPPQPLLSPTGAKLVGLGRPKALVSGLESFQLGTYGPGAGGDGAAEWEGGREGFQAAENVPKVDAFGPANFPPAGGSSAG